MAEIKVYYKNLKDRAGKVGENEAKGLRMLHDDFDPDWKVGDEPHGVMTFVTQDELPASLPTTDWQAEFDAATTQAAKIKVLARMMGLQVK